jgi:hypothetical protein
MAGSPITVAQLDTAILRLESQPDEARTIADTLQLVRTVGRSASTRDAPRLARLACAGEAVL